MELFGLDACWCEPFPFDRQLPRIEPRRIVLPATEPGIEPWSCDLGVVPVRYSGVTLGRFVLVPSSPTIGVAFAPAAREVALWMGATVGELAAAAMLAETNGAA